MIYNRFLLRAFLQIRDQQVQSQSSFAYLLQVNFSPLQYAEEVLLTLFFLKRYHTFNYLTNGVFLLLPLTVCFNLILFLNLLLIPSIHRHIATSPPWHIDTVFDWLWRIRHIHRLILCLERGVFLEYPLTVPDKRDQITEEWGVQLYLIVLAEVLLRLHDCVGERHVQEDQGRLLRVGLCLDHQLDWERVEEGHGAFDHEIGVGFSRRELQVLKWQVHRETFIKEVIQVLDQSLSIALREVWKILYQEIFDATPVHFINKILNTWMCGEC